VKDVLLISIEHSNATAFYKPTKSYLSLDRKILSAKLELKNSYKHLCITIFIWLVIANTAGYFGNSLVFRTVILNVSDDFVMTVHTLPTV